MYFSFLDQLSISRLKWIGELGESMRLERRGGGGVDAHRVTG